jgi:hypothetical protein
VYQPRDHAVADIDRHVGRERPDSDFVLGVEGGPQALPEAIVGSHRLAFQYGPIHEHGCIRRHAVVPGRGIHDGSGATFGDIGEQIAYAVAGGRVGEPADADGVAEEPIALG